MLLRAERLMDILSDLKRCRRDDWRGGRRAASRVGVRYTLQVRADAPLRLGPASARPAEPVRAWLRDLSASGVGLCCPEPVAVGTTIRLVLVQSGGGNGGGAADSSVEVPCVVRRCVPVAAGVYHIGASFSALWQASVADRPSAA